ncbi:RNA polymerase sigma-70 factor [Sunxiuqinia sp. A32]|uniref:RNA polymerase sigma-70 factor n=1 Tax=Sunxiuqinia sp. A32 TaxID=3461496 RepID=UPI004045A714
MNILSNNVIALLNQKNETAFELVFSTFYPRLVAFAKQYVPEEEALDHVHDAFVNLLEKTPSFNNENQLKSYLYTCVKNNCLMFLRHQNIKQKYSDGILSVNGIRDINVLSLEKLDTSEIVFKEIEQIIVDTIKKLPPKCQQVFLLSRNEDKRNLEVAELLEITEKAVEAHITKALKIFRIALKDYLIVQISLF